MSVIKNILRKARKLVSTYPPIGLVSMGMLRRLKPISSIFGMDRGKPIDRYYIENFLKQHCTDIQGVVLEIGDASYTEKFGGDRVARSEVLHAVPGNPKATMIGDLESGKGIPQQAFNCMILTQTFLCLYDIKHAIKNTHNAMAPGGVLLATFPGISQISRFDMERWGDYWRFTDASAKKLFGDVFGTENIKVSTFGNVCVACAYLHGLCVEDLKKKELDYTDPDYQLLISVRAVKSQEKP